MKKSLMIAAVTALAVAVPAASAFAADPAKYQRFGAGVVGKAGTEAKPKAVEPEIDDEETEIDDDDDEPEPVKKKAKTHMRVGRHGVSVRKAAPKDKAAEGEAAKAEAAKAEAPRLAANSAARSFSYESLNDGLLKASLSYTWKNKDWPGVRHILLGWGLSIGMFGIFLLMTLFFGCSLFEPQDPAKNPYLPPLEEGEVSTHVPGDTVELIRAWLFSCGLRFFLNEPMIILASKGLPMLFASAFCANLCGEVIVESLNLLVTIMIEVIKSIKS